MKKTLTTLSLMVMVLVVLGMAMLSSASTVRAQDIYGDPHFFLKRQAVWLLIAVVTAVVACRFDYHHWKRVRWLPLGFYLAVLAGLVLVFFPVIGGKVKGSYRWLNFGPIHVQPSEFAKIAIVVALSVWMDRVGRQVKEFKLGLLVPTALCGAYAVLLVCEPDFGATMVVLVLGGALIFVSGARVLYLAGIGLCGVVGLAGFVATNANRMERIRAWLEGTGSGSPAAYHLRQAILAFQNGGVCGVGLNQSIQKYNYLPEAHTDFIFAIGGEEWGFFFSGTVVLAFLVILVCGVLISLRAPDRLGRLLAFGMTLLLVFQGAFNICVVTGLAPTKGLALPFMSYGGTNLITALFAVGTLMNIGMHVAVYDERMHTEVVRNAVNQL